MRMLCYIAMLGQALFFAYGMFAVWGAFTFGLASPSDVAIALLLPFVSGLSAVMLFLAAGRFESGGQP